MQKLKRALGLFEVSVYGIGLILGAGIYALIGEAAGVAGNSLWMSFVFAAIIASFTGLSYAELSSLFPKSAAEYVYVEKAFKRRSLSFVIGWMTIFTGLFSSATVALGFGGYFSSLMSSLSNVPILFGAVLLIILMSLLNFYGIEQSSKANILFTAIEAFGLFFIIFLGLGHLGSVNYLDMPFGFSGIFTAAALIFFAYLGFEDIANIAEETKNPRKTLPKAMIISIFATTLIYILVSLSVVSILPWNELAQSSAPLADVASRALPGSSNFLSAVALFATANTVLIMLIVTARMLYGMANDGALPKILSKVHRKRRTPWISVAITMVFVLFFTIAVGNIRSVAEIANFGVLLVFVTVNTCLIYFRYSEPTLKREFKVPINIGKFPVLPLLGIIFSLFLMSHFKLITIVSGICFVMLGFVVFKLLEHFRASRVERQE